MTIVAYDLTSLTPYEREVFKKYVWPAPKHARTYVVEQLNGVEILHWWYSRSFQSIRHDEVGDIKALMKERTRLLGEIK